MERKNRPETGQSAHPARSALGEWRQGGKRGNANKDRLSPLAVKISYLGKREGKAARDRLPHPLSPCFQQRRLSVSLHVTDAMDACYIQVLDAFIKGGSSIKTRDGLFGREKLGRGHPCQLSGVGLSAAWPFFLGRWAACCAAAARRELW